MTCSLGHILKVSGPVALAQIEGAKIGDLVYVGKNKIISEVIRLDGQNVALALYEDATGIKYKDPAACTGGPFMAALGPGLVGGIFDGLGRALNNGTPFASGGIAGKLSFFGIDKKKMWKLENIKTGNVNLGDVICTIQETRAVTHKIFAPCGGKVSVKKKTCNAMEEFGEISSGGTKLPLTLSQLWPLKKERPYVEKRFPESILSTGQRVIDTLFPIARGGTAAMPGGFGSGKTVLGHQIAKHSDADIIIYVGCGERGNEMADVLEEFPRLKDPRTGMPLMERSVLIANTSNMPVTARICSIYFGALIGEYYRDMGYNALLIVDSTSRWAEALREVSGRLEELPGEEGYPVYLDSLIASFYGRAGVVKTNSGGIGSLTIVGAVSPSGGDFSEPVTQATKRVVRTFWSLNAALAYRRHYPAVDWLASYTSHLRALSGSASESEKREIMSVLQKEKDLERIARLVGYDALTKKDLFLLNVARVFREGFLQQSALDEVDKYTSGKKQGEMFRTILHLYGVGMKSFESGKELDFSLLSKLLEKTCRMKTDKKEAFEDLRREISSVIGG